MVDEDFQKDMNNGVLHITLIAPECICGKEREIARMMMMRQKCESCGTGTHTQPNNMTRLSSEAYSSGLKWDGGDSSMRCERGEGLCHTEGYVVKGKRVKAGETFLRTLTRRCSLKPASRDDMEHTENSWRSFCSESWFISGKVGWRHKRDRGVSDLRWSVLFWSWWSLQCISA